MTVGGSFKNIHFNKANLMLDGGQVIEEATEEELETSNY
jgi:hypothetical protein